MSRTINCFLLIAGLLGIAGGLSMRLDAPAVSYSAIGIGALFLALAFLLDNRHAMKIIREQHERTRQRVIELTARPWSPGQSLKVSGNSFFLLVVSVFISVACVMAIYGHIATNGHSWPMLLGGALFLPFSLLMIPRTLACIGKPACELDRDGINTPLYGRVAWKDIDGVHLQTMDYRGSKSSYLIFRVGDSPKVLKNVHWSERALSLIGLGAIRRRVISVQLDHRNETPETVAAVATFLWRQASGLLHDWNPMLSDAYNEATRRVSEVMAQHSSPDAIRGFISGNPEKALAQAEQLRADMETIRKERLKQSSRLNWTIGLVFIAILFFVIWPFLTRLSQ